MDGPLPAPPASAREAIVLDGAPGGDPGNSRRAPVSWSELYARSSEVGPRFSSENAGSRPYTGAKENHLDGRNDNQIDRSRYEEGRRQEAGETQGEIAPNREPGISQLSNS